MIVSTASAKIDRALAAIRSCRAVLVGDLVLDTYIYGETIRVSREAPVLVVKKERIEHRLGGAANAAANLAELGVNTRVIGVIGQDDAGRQVKAKLEAAHVDVSRLVSAQVTTPQKTRIMAGAFGTARQQVLRLDDEPDTQPQSVIERLLVELDDAAATADVLVVSDYGEGTVAQPVVEAVKILAAGGTLVCVDSRFRLGEFVGVTAVSPNLPEAAAAAGFPLPDQASVERAGLKIAKELNLKACLVTQGRGGMTLCRRDQPPMHVDIVGDDEVTDVTGAGDTVIATFSAALAAGLGMVNAMLLANCAAGVSVMRAGAATVTPDEVRAAVRGGQVELEPCDE